MQACAEYCGCSAELGARRGRRGQGKGKCRNVSFAEHTTAGRRRESCVRCRTAEMAALSTAARLGNQVKGAVLYCTTFPCHNCSKHIVAAGIKSVFFLEPYGKSFTEDLYPDSIDVDKKTSLIDAVQFNQFIGITPNRYAEVFSKEKLKDSKGNVLDWQKDKSQPIFEKLDQGHIDREVMFQKYVSESIDTDSKEVLGLPID